ncbi:hypothetical protein IAU59_007544 [Kwoniella sp. CBS 9459]
MSAKDKKPPQSSTYVPNYYPRTASERERYDYVELLAHIEPYANKDGCSDSETESAKVHPVGSSKSRHRPRGLAIGQPAWPEGHLDDRNGRDWRKMRRQQRLCTRIDTYNELPPDEACSQCQRGRHRCIVDKYSNGRKVACRTCRGGKCDLKKQRTEDRDQENDGLVTTTDMAGSKRKRVDNGRGLGAVGGDSDIIQVETRFTDYEPADTPRRLGPRRQNTPTSAPPAPEPHTLRLSSPDSSRKEGHDDGVDHPLPLMPLTSASTVTDTVPASLAVMLSHESDSQEVSTLEVTSISSIRTVAPSIRLSPPPISQSTKSGESDSPRTRLTTTDVIAPSIVGATALDRELTSHPGLDMLALAAFTCDSHGSARNGDLQNEKAHSRDVRRDVGIQRDLLEESGGRSYALPAKSVAPEVPDEGLYSVGSAEMDVIEGERVGLPSSTHFKLRHCLSWPPYPRISRPAGA